MWRTLWGTYSPIRQWYFTWKPPVVTVMTRGNLTIIHCFSIYASPPSWFPLAVYICLHRAGNRMSTTEGAARERLFYSACALIYIYDQTEITITGLKMKSKQVKERERVFGHFSHQIILKASKWHVCAVYGIWIQRHFYQHHPHVIREHHRYAFKIPTHKL